mmetsp:Transcript_76192/g.134909  ORF Transcript_76192/g.134909 Transcript_76192/m.134909 type:complete len:183 (+) Transcript_76192:49-597(+)
MHARATVVFALVVFGGQGSRLRTETEQTQADATDLVQALAKILLAFNPTGLSPPPAEKAHARIMRPRTMGLSMGPKPLHWNGFTSFFNVTKATEEQIKELSVKSWPTWSTSESEKYKVGVKSPLKTYGINELSYIISGKMEITPEGGEPVLVQAGDFITFPEDFRCYWYVIEEINKHYYEYD